MPGEQAWKFKPYTRQTIRQAPQWNLLGADLREAVEVVSRVLPFRVNAYVLEELIDWDNVPDDPIYRLTFPHRDMLREPEYAAIRDLLSAGASEAEIQQRVHAIRMRMNPHPAGQMTHNVPQLDGAAGRGAAQVQRNGAVLSQRRADLPCLLHVLLPLAAVRGHGRAEVRRPASADLATYLRRHAEVTDVLITGGDPLVMNARSLTDYIEPLLAPDLAHIQHIRIGTKAVAYWPQRFVTDKDADDLLRLFETVVRSGRNLALMGHYNHPAELRHPIAQQALRRIIATGATVRIQAPLIRHINENPADWAELWTTGVRLGAVPYYMFVERDTGPSDYFAAVGARLRYLPAGLPHGVRTGAHSARAVHERLSREGAGRRHCRSGRRKVFALQFLQARNPDWVRRPFYARFDPLATWLDELQPAFGEKRFFFQQDGVAPSPTIPMCRPARRARTGTRPATWR